MKNISNDISNDIMGMSEQQLCDIGLIKDLDINLYHQSTGLCSSNLKKILRSPLHYMSSLTNPENPTPEMLFGTAAHCALLEPDRFEQTYIEVPKIDRRTKDGKAEYQRIIESGKTPLSTDDFARIQDMQKSIFSNKILKTLFGEGVSEISAYGELPNYPGILLKCRPDHYNSKLQVIVDLKTACDGSPNAFAKAAANYQYHLQAAYYMDLFQKVAEAPVQAFIFCVVEKEAPYAVSLYQLDIAAIERGRELYRSALNSYAECVKTQVWPGYSQRIETIELPKWAF